MPNESPEPSNAENGDERPAKRKRVAVACQSCRDRKSKCDGQSMKTTRWKYVPLIGNCQGQTPTCGLCSQAGNECLYPSPLSKTDLLRQDVVSMVGGLENRIGGIERMLTSFQQTLSAPPGHDPITPVSRTSALVTPAQAGAENEIIIAEDAFQSSAQIGPPTDGVGIVPLSSREDTAFFGPSSNIALLRLVSRALAKHAASNQALDHSRSSMAPLTEGLGVRDRREVTSDPMHTPFDASPAGTSQTFKLPPDQRMRELLASYFRTCNPFHPYVHEGRFMDTYEEVRRSNFRSMRRSWLAMMYMLFALGSISAPYETATVAIMSPESEEWFGQASDLCLKQVFSEQGITHEVAQVLMWMVAYLQSKSSSSKAWLVHGMAVRVCYQLGLHSAEASQVADPIEREARKRTWAGLVLLDCTLTMTFGRPPQIHNPWTTLERPRTFSDSAQRGILAEDEASVTFLNVVLQLYEILKKAVQQLYGDNWGARLSFSVETFAKITGLESELLQWSRTLPPQLAIMEYNQITPELLQHTDLLGITARKQRTVLTFRLLNARILIHRPLLESLLEAITSEDADIVYLQSLRQAAANSVSFGVTCATKLIYIMHHLLTTSQQDEALQHLGAWWYSIYYVFNSALAILGGLLVSTERWDCAPILSKSQRKSAIEAITQSLGVLDALDKGCHSTVSRCRSYLRDLMALASPILTDDTNNTLNNSAFVSGFFNASANSFDQDNWRQLATDVNLESFMFPTADMQALGANAFWD